MKPATHGADIELSAIAAGTSKGMPSAAPLQDLPKQTTAQAWGLN